MADLAAKHKVCILSQMSLMFIPLTSFTVRSCFAFQVA